MNDDDPQDLEIFFLPLAVPFPDAIRAAGLDPGVLSRRLPDFLHQLLNEGEYGPVGMLELQAPGEAGEAPSRVVPEVPPDPQEAFDMVPDDGVRAVVTGEVRLSGVESGECLEIDLQVHCLDDLPVGLSTTLTASVDLDNPVKTLRQLGARLARVLGLQFGPIPAGFLTEHGPAFFRFLAALDAAPIPSSELGFAPRVDPEKMLAPLADALTLDPGFGLALRVVRAALFSAMISGRDNCRLITDRCLNARPTDGEACVGIAEGLLLFGDRERACEWLAHAATLPAAPSRALERLGILALEDGDPDRARSIWSRGVVEDGNPNFFAHLMRLGFTQEDGDVAWNWAERGLRHMRERSLRAAEWDEAGRPLGLLLTYLWQALADRPAPKAVIRAMLDLTGCLDLGEDRIELGLCLQRVEASVPARREIRRGLTNSMDFDVRDRGIRALMTIDVPDFERRFSRAAEQVVKARDPRRAVAELRRLAREQPEFWPARFFEAVGLRRMGQIDEALDALQDVQRLRPGQVESAREMAAMFAARGNPKRALELVEDALSMHPASGPLSADRALYLFALDQIEEARVAVEVAMAFRKELDAAQRKALELLQEQIEE